MFLTRVRLNPRRRGAQKLVSSPHATHAAVQSAFPEQPDTGSGRVLWRLDRHGSHATLYVVSPTEPEFTHLVEQAGWPELGAGWDTRSYLPLLEKLRAGQHWSFRLTANPVHSVREKGSQERGKLRGHVTVAQQQKWLRDRQERAGFATAGPDEVDAPSVVERKRLSFERNGRSVFLRTVTYEGVLTITDAEQFVRTLTQGLGRAKGYGCGLLTIAAAG